MIAAASALLGLLILPACQSLGGGNNSGNDNTPAFTIVITPTFPAIAIGDTEQFTAATVDPTTGAPVTLSGYTFSWMSSDTTVATINSGTGMATAVGAGSTTITVSLINPSGNGDGQQITTMKVSPPLSLNAGPLVLGAVAVPYSANGLASMRSGGNGPFAWSLVNGTTLPTNLSLNSNGSISGAPSVAGVSPSFTVKVTDSETPPVSQQMTYSITVVDPVNSPCSIISNTNPWMMNGSYAILLQGFQASSTNGTPLAMASSFSTDGAGGITGGEADLNVSAGPQHLTINGGTYAVNASGQGCVQLKYTTGGANVFHFALSQVLNASNVATHGRIIEFDAYQGLQGGSASNLASGVILLQDSSEFSTSSLAARYAFGEDGFDMDGKHVAVGGAFDLDNANGNLSSFAEDSDDGGTISTVTGATGMIMPTTTTGTTGRETVSVTLPGPTTVHLASYIVNANEALLISTDTLGASYPIVSGRAIVTGNAYTASSLSGNYIYRAEGVDFEGDGANCAASGPCALTQLAIVTANTGSGAITGTLFELQAGATQTSTISGITYSVDASTGRVQLTSTSGAILPVLYLAAPVTSGMDLTEPTSAFIVGSGPVLNSTSGDPTALFGVIETQPNGPYVLSSPPSYVLSTEDPGQITLPNVAGNGSFSSGTISVTRDISNMVGLVSNAPTTISFTVNPDGTLNGALSTIAVGVTNNTAASPGKILFIPGNGTGVRVIEP